MERDKLMSLGIGLSHPSTWRQLEPDIWSRAREIRDWLAHGSYEAVWFIAPQRLSHVAESTAAHLSVTARQVRFIGISAEELLDAPHLHLRSPARQLVVLVDCEGNAEKIAEGLDFLHHSRPQADWLLLAPEFAGDLACELTPGPRRCRRIALRNFHRGPDSAFAAQLVLLAAFEPNGEKELRSRLENTLIAADNLNTFPATRMRRGLVVFAATGAALPVATAAVRQLVSNSQGAVAGIASSVIGLGDVLPGKAQGPKSVVLLRSADPFSARHDDDVMQALALSGDVDVTAFPAISNEKLAEDPGGWSAACQWLACMDFVEKAYPASSILKPAPRPHTAASTATDSRPYLVGGIDLGGTKIEACLFDRDLERVASLRIATPTDSYAALLDAIVDQAHWLDLQAGQTVPIGIGVPGTINIATGISSTANLPADGQPVRADLSRRLARDIVVDNDCRCLALSEANAGAAGAYRTVFGLILGTGVGGGVCRNGMLERGLNGLPGEVGHMCIPSEFLKRHDLHIIRCGCGRPGCFETYLSGPGIRRLARAKHADTDDPVEIAHRAARGDETCMDVMTAWYDLLSELISIVQVTIDPDCVVIGGGLSRIEALTESLEAAFVSRCQPNACAPVFVKARFGDSSGVRGAAMLAMGQWTDRIATQSTVLSPTALKWL